ncbi:hypothetical protein MERGE_000902 [Pneumocystis wakefieldiae]|uniref:Protein PET100, mitochondrial n=1 Tax=Pneumocystis wakefieldiae TaxID=38082 RepID=A0A899G2Z8_9ASCO|nr:hypothetical protein MERGE_000902 [Pneumocystis wakefieldiae]
MNGTNLEILKFGIYVIFPVGIMYYFGSPSFYRKYVKELNFWPPKEKTNCLPVNKNDIKNELHRLKTEKYQTKTYKISQEDS